MKLTARVRRHEPFLTRVLGRRGMEWGVGFWGGGGASPASSESGNASENLAGGRRSVTVEWLGCNRSVGGECHLHLCLSLELFLFIFFSHGPMYFIFRVSLFFILFVGIFHLYIVFFVLVYISCFFHFIRFPFLHLCLSFLSIVTSIVFNSSFSAFYSLSLVIPSCFLTNVL